MGWGHGELKVVEILSFFIEDTKVSKHLLSRQEAASERPPTKRLLNLDHKKGFFADYMHPPNLQPQIGLSDLTPSVRCFLRVSGFLPQGRAGFHSKFPIFPPPAFCQRTSDRVKRIRCNGHHAEMFELCFCFRPVVLELELAMTSARLCPCEIGLY